MDPIIDIKVQYAEAIKIIAEYTLKLNQLREEEKALTKELQQKTKELKDSKAPVEEITKLHEKYAEKLAGTRVEMNYNQKAIQVLNKEIQDNIQYEQAQEGSIEKLRAELALNIDAYNKLSEAQKQVVGAQFQQQIEETTQKLREEEKALNDHHQAIGDYMQAGKDLKDELMEITGQLNAITEAGKEAGEVYTDLAERAAELGKATEDVNVTIGAMGNTANIDDAVGAVTDLVEVCQIYSSTLALLGLENESLEQTMKALQIVQTALLSLQSLMNIATKNKILTDIASQALQKIGINQTLMQAKAETALNVVKGNGTIATKAVAAAQWLWNAALSANPVLVILVGIMALIAGVTALMKVFDSSAKAEKEAAKAAAACEEQRKKTATAITQINNNEKNAINERNNNLRGEILELKKSGATSEQIAQAKMKAEQDIRDMAIKASQDRMAQQDAEKKVLLEYLEAEEKTLATYSEKSKKYQEQKKAVDELKASLDVLNQARADETQVQVDLIIQGKEAVQQAKEQAKQRAQQAAQSAKERANKEREAIRQAEDAALALVEEGVEKQRQAINQSYDRQIEDLRKKIAEDEKLKENEQKLTKKAKEEIDKIIIALEEKKQQELDKISEEEIKKRIEDEAKLIEMKLQSVKQGTEQEFQLRKELLEKQREIESNNAELTGAMKEAVDTKYIKQLEDLQTEQRKKELDDQKAAIDLEWRQRLDGVMQGSIEESNLKLQLAQEEYNKLALMDEESKAILFENETAYQNALLDNKQKLRDAELENRKVLQESVEMQLQAAQAIGDGFSQVLEAFAGDNEALAAFAKTIALFNIGLSTAEALAKGVAAAQSVPFPGNLLAIATTIGTILANMAKVKQLLSKESQPKAPKFSTGGVVSGSGSGSSDTIVAKLSSGESVLTAPTTAMFAPVLSALNQIGGGIPINIVKTANQAMGEEMLARAFAKGIASLPNPVVSVQDINTMQERVRTLESLSLGG